MSVLKSSVVGASVGPAALQRTIRVDVTRVDWPAGKAVDALDKVNLALGQLSLLYEADKSRKACVRCVNGCLRFSFRPEITGNGKPAGNQVVIASPVCQGPHST